MPDILYFPPGPKKMSIDSVVKYQSLIIADDILEWINSKV